MKFKKEILLSIFSIFIFILFFEIGLRIIGFDYHPIDIGFNISENYKIFEIKDDYYVIKKEEVGIFQEQKFLVNKPKNELRIFILGGSSVYNLNFFDYMDYFRSKLEQVVNKKQLKIINIAQNGGDTDKLLQYFPEIFDYDPDLIIIYSGHNEFLRMIHPKHYLTNTYLIRLNNRLIKISRLYQLEFMVIKKIRIFVFNSFIKQIKEKKNQFNLFPCYTKPIFGVYTKFDKAEIYRNYKNSIIQMIKLAKKNKVDIILSTVAYNRMFPPFEPYDDYYEYCESLFIKKNFDEALVCFDQALDSDLLPVRATKTSNEIIKNISKTYKIPLADVDQKIVKDSKYNIPGLDLFVDHNHLNYDGNKILLDVFYDTITDNGLLS